jgi:uncharacterized membrane protein YphA (DoxX/SURF4 family)
VIARLRDQRWAHLFVANLRLLLGFAFLPAGIKKVLGQPFTDPDKVGAFHDFLHAFHATGSFYRFVGCLQLVAAALLLTQVRATLGALVALPIITAIVALCWSTGVVPTAIVATLMWLGTAALVVWDERAWRAIVGRGSASSEASSAPAGRPLLDARLWAKCGATILIVYVALTALAGEVYRPRKIELDRPSFYLLVALPLLPLATWLIERSRRRTTSA